MSRMKQKPTTPQIKNCICGSVARVYSDDGDYSQRGGYGFMFMVMCESCRKSTKYCGSRHRAICKWNNKQSKRKPE